MHIGKSKSTNTGFQVTLRFRLVQHSRDRQLMSSIMEYLACGNLYENYQKSAVYFVVTKLSDLNKIISRGRKILFSTPTFQPPGGRNFFDKYHLQGLKKLNYRDFCRVAKLMKDKAHLTVSDLEELKKNKSEMNSGRKVYSDEIFIKAAALGQASSGLAFCTLLYYFLPFTVYYCLYI
jgi:hypothetical protein